MTRRNLSFLLGDEVWLQGRAHIFTGEACREGGGLSESRDLTFRDKRTAAPVLLSASSFNDLYVSGEVRVVRTYERHHHRPPEAGGTEEATAQWRRLWCEAYDREPCSKSDAGLRLFISAHGPALALHGAPPSPGALRVWLRERGAVGDRRARFMQDRKPGVASSRMEALTQRILAEKAEAFYDGLSLNPHAVYCATRNEIARLNTVRKLQGVPVIRAPSESTVRRYLSRHLDYGSSTRRFGWRVGGRPFVPIRGSMAADHILEKAIIDQTLIDCAVVDDEHLINVGRPWLAVMIDVRSRYPLAFHLTFEPPSVETVLACVRQAVRPKTELERAHPDVNGEWLGFGVPDTVVVDNAWENTGSSFRDACADANISIVFAPVAAPEYKGICERFFHTLNTMLFHRLPGGLPYTPQQRKKLGIGGETDAVLLLSDVRKAVYQCIVEVYGRHFHKALQAAPEQVWRKEAPLHGRPYVEDLAGLDIALAKLAPEPRRVTRAGVIHKDLTYRTPGPLAELLADLLPHQKPRSSRGGSALVKVKYHPEDLSHIFVWNEVRRCYAILDCTQPSYAAGLSENHHRRIRAHARSEHLAFQTEDERCAARARLQEVLLPAIPLERIRDRQRAQRLRTQAPLGAAPSPLKAPVDGVPITPIGTRSGAASAYRAPMTRALRKSKAASTKSAHLTNQTPATLAAQLFEEEFSRERRAPQPSATLFEEFFLENGQ